MARAGASAQSTTAASPSGTRLASEPSPRTSVAELRERYAAVRSTTERLSAALSAEDCQVQSMPDASPTKWHLAHTSWFFETFVLTGAAEGYSPAHPQYGYLFNSYYEAVGPRHARPERGLLTRPSLDEVMAYRRHVDAHVQSLLLDESLSPELRTVILTGIHHEQQHQELILTDIKHAFSRNALQPAYHAEAAPAGPATAASGALEYVAYPESTTWIGHGGEGFAYDNETPRHRAHVPAFALATRLATNGEYLEFMRDRGYERVELWLSDGWQYVNQQGIKAPLYWECRDGSWWQYTLRGLREVDADEPVCHVSYYEADAFARWAGARLPREQEWELAAATAPLGGNLLDRGRFHPAPLTRAAASQKPPQQLFGDVWEWTQSHYSAYPGYRAVDGALGEYNGKFMCGQFVLRGGSCTTPESHIRATYRNFFPPHARWQFTGVRLANDEP